MLSERGFWLAGFSGKVPHVSDLPWFTEQKLAPPVCGSVYGRRWKCMVFCVLAPSLLRVHGLFCISTLFIQEALWTYIILYGICSAPSINFHSFFHSFKSVWSFLYHYQHPLHWRLCGLFCIIISTLLADECMVCPVSALSSLKSAWSFLYQHPLHGYHLFCMRLKWSSSFYITP